MIRVYVDETDVREVEEYMGPESGASPLAGKKEEPRMRKEREEEKEKEKEAMGKKGGGKMKPTLPISDSCFKKEPIIVRDKLGSLHLAKYPFDVKVRAIKDGKLASRNRPQRAQGSEGGGAARPRAQSRSAKRRSESREQEAKRRSQTPHRYQQHTPEVPDPWAQAVQAQQLQQRVDEGMGRPPQALISTSLPSAAASASSPSTALQSRIRSEQPLQQQQPVGPVMFGQRIHA